MKTMTLYRPGAIQNTFGDFDRYIESFFGDSIFAPAARVCDHLPAVDIRETGNAYLLDMELPGFDEKDIEIHVDGTSVSVSSKKEESGEKSCGQKETGEDNEERETWILRERRGRSFSRSFKLPENADPEDVNAAFKNGVLSLEVKKRPEAKRREIRINAS